MHICSCRVTNLRQPQFPPQSAIFTPLQAPNIYATFACIRERFHMAHVRADTQQSEFS